MYLLTRTTPISRLGSSVLRIHRAELCKLTRGETETRACMWRELLKSESESEVFTRM